MLIIHNLAYIHANRELLFENINLTINRHDKVALAGNNGTGKSTLLKLIAGILQPSSGQIRTAAKPYYVPQLFGQFNHLSIAQALQVHEPLQALHEILDGRATEQNMALLNDDWAIEERCREALAHWQLPGLDLWQKMETLSGGQKTKVFLAGIAIHRPGIVLLDEPSNHLDTDGRQLLYDFTRSSSATLVIVSHDIKLLKQLDTICELNKNGINVYGGNYDFYAAQKQLESNALDADLGNKEKALRKAKEVERETAERRQKLDARGRKKQEKAGLPAILMNTFKNNAEKSTSRLKGVLAEKAGEISQELNDLRKALPDPGKMKFDFGSTALHKGKILFSAKGINHRYAQGMLWRQGLDLQIASGERMALKGLNGSGKTTLVKIILGGIEPAAGIAKRADNKIIYIDQDYSIINNLLNVYEQAQAFNLSALQEHEVKKRLSRFLFTKYHWDKPCGALSGGEKMRLALCCLNISSRAPDIIILDEPTNNLDIQNVEILSAAVNAYEGTLIVISHDQHFLEQLNLERTIDLE